MNLGLNSLIKPYDKDIKSILDNVNKTTYKIKNDVYGFDVKRYIRFKTILSIISVLTSVISVFLLVYIASKGK